MTEDILIPNNAADEIISTISFITEIYLTLYTIVSIVAWLFCTLCLNDDMGELSKIADSHEQESCMNESFVRFLWTGSYKSL